MRPKSLAEIYCERVGIERSDYLQTVFKRALYPHARPFAPILRLFHREHFAADYDFVSDVGGLLRFRDFELSVDGFVNHPANRGWLRHLARIRVSARRLQRLMLEVLPKEAVHSTSKFKLHNDTLAPFTESSSGDSKADTVN